MEEKPWHFNIVAKKKKLISGTTEVLLPIFFSFFHAESSSSSVRDLLPLCFGFFCSSLLIIGSITTINIGFKLTLIHPSSPPSAQQQHPFPLLFFFHSSSLLFCDWCCYLAVELSLEWLIQLKPGCLHLSRQKKGAEPLVSSPWPLLLLLLLTVDNIEPQPAN